MTHTTQIAIKNGNVIDIHSGAKRRQDILVEGERIKEICEAGALSIPKGAQFVDASGQYLIPGLWDAHVHMSFWSDYTEQISTLFVANGVTSIRDFGGRLEDIVALRDRNREPDVIAPRMWIAGPIIDGAPMILAGPSRNDMSVQVDSALEATGMVDKLQSHGVDFVKPYEMLKPDVFESLIKRAQKFELPAAGHVPIRMTIQEVLEIGQYDVQHLGGSASGLRFDCLVDACKFADRTAILDERAPDASGLDLLIEIDRACNINPEDVDPRKVADQIKLFAEKKTFHTPTLVMAPGPRELGFAEDPFFKRGLSYVPHNRVQSVIGTLNAVGNPSKSGKYRFNSWRLDVTKQMQDAGVMLLAGTDAPAYPAGVSLHFELRAFVAAGLSPLEALQTATVNPPKFFKLSDEMGSIEVGKIADMVLLSADPTEDISNTEKIQSVVSRGVVYDRKYLDSVLKTIVEGCEESK